MQEIKFYAPAEERINILSHALGLLFSIVALVLLLVRAARRGEFADVVSFGIFGLSLVCLYGASTLYHSTKTRALRARLRIVDHASIYILIAGTYTPFALITLNGATGRVIFIVTWSMALTGIVLKLFYTGRFNLISTLVYILMGWVIIFALNPLLDNLPTNGLYWLFAGGIAYTAGAVLYSIGKMAFNHAIFHMFVLAGSFCHFWAVYFHVLPVGY